MRPNRLDTARIFERVFAIYRRQAGVLLPTAVLLYIVPAALGLSRDVSVQVLVLAANLIVAVWYGGMVVLAVRDIDEDDVRDLTIGGLFRAIAPVLAPLLWTAILVSLGVFCGLLLFIV